MNAQMLPMPNPEEWTTIDGAAKIMSVSRRMIARMLADGRLTGYQFRESRGRFLWVPEVEHVRDARAIALGSFNDRQALCA